MIATAARGRSGRRRRCRRGRSGTRSSEPFADSYGYYGRSRRYRGRADRRRRRRGGADRLRDRAQLLASRSARDLRFPATFFAHRARDAALYERRTHWETRFVQGPEAHPLRRPRGLAADRRRQGRLARPTMPARAPGRLPAASAPSRRSMPTATIPKAGSSRRSITA